MLGDKAWEIRANNLISITKRTQRKLNEAGLPVNAVPPRLLLPIIENCSVEDNETLQEMWAGLIVTASQETDSMSPSLVETLKQLTPVEASLLQECWANTICPALETGRGRSVEFESSLREMRRKSGLPDEPQNLRTSLGPLFLGENQHGHSRAHSDTLERLGLIRKDFGVQVKTKRGDDDEITDVESEIGHRFVYTKYAVKFLEACNGESSEG